MKLIITGASGFVATEVLRQALHLPSITSIVALARKSVSAPGGTPAENASKLTSVVVEDYGTYSDDVKKQLAGADACIWTVAITPSKANALPVETVRKVCQEWTVAGLTAILDANPNPPKPFRFLYMSGIAASDPARKHTKDVDVWTPKSMMEYSKMRGETATKIIDLAEAHTTPAEICVAKPGFITGQGGIFRGLFGAALQLTGAVETIDIKVVSAVMLHRVINGFDGTDGILLNREMVSLGNEVLSKG